MKTGLQRSGAWGFSVIEKKGLEMVAGKWNSGYGDDGQGSAIGNNMLSLMRVYMTKGGSRTESLKRTKS